METVSGALTTLTTVFSQISTWVGEVVTTIASTPLLLLPVGIFVFGAVAGLAKRFIGR